MSGNPMEGIPSDGVSRIQEARGQGNEKPLFTSDLSVNEFALINQAGFEPRGLVVGSSVYHIGIQFRLPNSNIELTNMSGALYNARELAMNRMKEETRALGADGVVGVRLQVQMFAFGEHIIEFQAIGTAISMKDRTHAPHGDVFTSHLSGQDFWTLINTGYRPLSLVLGTCVYHVAYQGMRQTLMRATKNVEMEQYTQAIYDARELAMRRMQHEARRVDAAGIVGVDLREDSYAWDSHIIEFFATGTAVAPLDGNDIDLLKPTAVLPLT